MFPDSPPPAAGNKVLTYQGTDIRKRDWAAVHLAGDRNPPLRLWPRLGRYAGEGLRRERGGERG